VHANDLIVNHGATGEAVEGVAELLPHLDGEAAATLVVKSVDAINASAFMVPPEQEEVLGVLDLIGKQQAHNFQ
jgi:hypothetical protein